MGAQVMTEMKNGKARPDGRGHRLVTVTSGASSRSIVDWRSDQADMLPQPVAGNKKMTFGRVPKGKKKKVVADDSRRR